MDGEILSAISQGLPPPAMSQANMVSLEPIQRLSNPHPDITHIWHEFKLQIVIVVGCSSRGSITLTPTGNP